MRLRIGVIHNGRLQNTVKIDPSPPLVRFCPHFPHLPLPPPCGRPLWMTPQRRAVFKQIR